MVTELTFLSCVVQKRHDEGGAIQKGCNQKINRQPWFNKVRSVPIWGHTGGDHMEIKYENVRVPLECSWSNIFTK